jgi:hypothetical protein
MLGGMMGCRPFKWSDVENDLVFTVHDSRMDNKAGSGIDAPLTATDPLIAKAKTPAQKYLNHKPGIIHI